MAVEVAISTSTDPAVWLADTRLLATAVEILNQGQEDPDRHVVDGG